MGQGALLLPTPSDWLYTVRREGRPARSPPLPSPLVCAEFPVIRDRLQRRIFFCAVGGHHYSEVGIRVGAVSNNVLDQIIERTILG